MNPVLLDLTHTAHTRSRTGIQRVSRALRTVLGPEEALGICYDPYERIWRPLEAWEEGNLAHPRASKGRKAHWPLFAALKGTLRRLRGRPSPFGASQGRALILPEIFSPEVYRALPEIRARNLGPTIALFPDAVALQWPEFSPPSVKRRYPNYLRELLSVDAVAAISQTSKEALLDYWRWLGATQVPRVEAIVLAVDPPTLPSATPRGTVPTVLSVGTLEGRKNHLSLLRACESLWSGGARFELRLVGQVNLETGKAALDLVHRLRRAGRPIRYEGPVSEEKLEAAYASCAFTVYPSVAEGYGLPVAESLVRGKPCICADSGALGEISQEGGCLLLKAQDPGSIAAAIERLLTSPAELAALESAARSRTFPTWSDYSRRLLTWIDEISSSLPQRAEAGAGGI